MNQEEFARQLIHALDEGTRELEAPIANQLFAIRRAATADPHAHHAGRNVLALAQHHLWLTAVLAAGLLLAGWLLYQPPQAPENSEVDILLLTEGIPPQAYADWSLVKRDNLEQQCLAAN